MKKYLIASISLFLVVSLAGISYARIQTKRQASPLPKFTIPQAPATPQIIVLKGPPEFGMPLTQQEQFDCNKNLSELAHILDFPVHIAAPAGGTPSGAQSDTLRSLIQTAFPVENPFNLGPRVSEESLGQLIASGTSANKAYNKILAFLDNTIPRLSKIKEIFIRYPGVLSNSRETLSTFLDDHMNYYKSLKEDTFEYAYDYALNNVIPDDGTDKGLEGETMIELDSDLNETAVWYSGFAEKFQREVIKATPTEAGDRKRPPLRK